jgi:hypothetical protein
VSGQISNVSAVVLPERHPVVDDDERRQLPMFPTDPRVDLLIRLLGDSVEAAKAMANLNHALLQKFELFDEPRNGRTHTDAAPEVEAKKPPKPKRPGHCPNEKEMRDWPAFRAKYQKLERDIRRDLSLAEDDEVSREMMFANGGEHPKTMLGHMLWHGLTRVQWPPSTWREAPPRLAG